MDGAHRPSWLAAVDAPVVQGRSASAWSSRVRASWLSPSAVTVRVYAACPPACRAARAASEARVERRLPQTLREHPGPRLGRMTARRPAMVAGSPSRPISRHQAPPAPLAPAACRVPSARLVDCANTASARTRAWLSAAGRRGSHTRALVACTTNERGCRARRNIIRPVPLLAAPPVVLPATCKEGALMLGYQKGNGAGRPWCSTGHAVRYHVASHPAPRRHPGSLGDGSVQQASRPPRCTRTEGHSPSMSTPWEHQRPPCWTALVTCLLTGRTARGGLQVSGIRFRFMADHETSPSHAQCHRLQPISTSSLCPRYVRGNRSIAYPPAPPWPEGQCPVIIPQAAKPVGEHHPGATHRGDMAAILHVAARRPGPSVGPPSRADRFSISPTWAAMIASMHDDSEESPVVKGS